MLHSCSYALKLISSVAKELQQQQLLCGSSIILLLCFLLCLHFFAFFCFLAADCFVAEQEAKLHQLSIDLKSELTSGSLAQLKHMVSEFMQQLRDSTSRQSHTDALGSGSPLGLPAQPTAHHTLSANHGLGLSPESALQLAASGQPQLGLLAGPIAPHTAPTGLHSAKSSTFAPHPSSSRELQPDSSITNATAQQLDSSNSIQPQSEHAYAAESVLTEDDIELDLPQTEADSTIEEEAGLAGSAAAESVAESVSDIQYSMYFEDSAQRSPISAYRSAAPGDSKQSSVSSTDCTT